MPKGILEFNLDTESDAFLIASRAQDYKIALQDILNHLRDKLKYDTISEVEHQVYTEVQEELHSILNSYTLDV